MDKLIQYEKVVLAFLEEYADRYKADPSGVETFIVADREHRHYQIVRSGWSHGRFIHYMPFHLRIKNNKVWIQENNSEDLIGDDLVRLGIPKHGIVLGFQPEEVRPLTGFGVA